MTAGGIAKRSPKAAWEHLRDNGLKKLVDVSSNKLIEQLPYWFDEERFKLGREAILKYHIGISYSSLTGLLLILQLPDGLEPLLATGNSKDILTLHKRYLNTTLHVNSWYDDDILDPSTKGYKSIRQVRAMHKRVQSLMTDKFKVLDEFGKPGKWYNQHEVALTQFAFIGLAMLYPKKTAMIAASQEELEHINYYWRVLGWFMGIADEFNACQFDKYEDIQEFNRLIFQHEYLDKFAKADCPVGLKMTQTICAAMQDYVPLATFNTLAHWWSDCFQFNGYEPQPTSIKEKLMLLWTRWSFDYFLKNPTFLRLSTQLHRKRFDQRVARRDDIFKRLKAANPDTSGCTFLSDRVDYFGKDPQVRSDSEDPEQCYDEEEQKALEVDFAKAIEGSGRCPFIHTKSSKKAAPVVVVDDDKPADTSISVPA